MCCNRRIGIVFVQTPADLAFKFFVERIDQGATMSEFLAAREADVEQEVESFISKADAVLYNWTGTLQYRETIRAMLEQLGASRMHDVMSGGYNEGYERCSCFWGTEPGSFLKLITHYETSFTGRRALDAGCGEGKNAVFLARHGANVDAVDVSPVAIENGRRVWKQEEKSPLDCGGYPVSKAASRSTTLSSRTACSTALLTEREVMATISALQAATVRGGYNILCAFNNRHQQLNKAHPRFSSMSARPSRVPVSL